MTVRSRPVFTVKAYPNEKPWICVEPMKAEKGMPPGVFGFDLDDGVDASGAEEIAKYMNDNLKHFTYTP